MSRRARRRQRSREHKLRCRVATAIRQAVRDCVPDLATHGVPASKVNWGWCEDVSEGAHDRLEAMGITSLVVKDDDELRYTTHEIYGDDAYTHAWIWVEGKHHDAERPFGVRRWLDLPHFQRWLENCPDMEPVDIEPVLSHGDEQRMFYRTASWQRGFKLAMEGLEYP